MCHSSTSKTFVHFIFVSPSSETATKSYSCNNDTVVKVTATVVKVTLTVVKVTLFLKPFITGVQRSHSWKAHFTVDMYTQLPALTLRSSRVVNRIKLNASVSKALLTVYTWGVQLLMSPSEASATLTDSIYNIYQIF